MFDNIISNNKFFKKIDETRFKRITMRKYLLVIIPTFLCERQDVSLRGEMKNINLNNFTFRKFVQLFLLV